MSKRLRKSLAMLLVGVTVVTTTQVKALDYVGHWAEYQLKEWVEEGVLTGYEDGTLRPNEQVTRAEFAKMLVEVFGLMHTEDDTKLEDVVEGAWYEEAIACVVTAGFMKHENQMFRPHAIITREEAAYAVAKAYHMDEQGEVVFEDASSISEWAQDEVNALALSGYLQGYGDGTFRPQGSLTRAEAVMMLDQITADIINQAGTYTESIEGNLVVNTTDVILKDMTISGNLYLAEGIGEGDVTLDNVVVLGHAVVEGGGENSIELIGTTLDTIVVNKASGGVRLAADSQSTMGSVQVQSAVQLEGKIEKVEVATPQEVKLVGATVEEVKVVQQDAKVQLDKDTVLKNLVADAKVEVSGTGVIEKAEINADDVKIEGVILDKENITVGEEVKEPPKVEVPNTGGNTSGGSTSGGSSGGDSGETVEPVQKSTIKGVVKLEEELAVGAEVSLWKMTGDYTSTRVATTTTDLNGNYVFNKVDKGNYRLEIKYKKDDAIYETSVAAFPVGSSTIVQDVVLEKKESTALSFTVTSEEEAVVEAKVYAEAYVQGVTNWGDYGKTDTQGQVVLSSSHIFPIGTEVKIRVEKEGYETYTSTYITTAEGMNDVSVVLEKEAPKVYGTIQGSVILEEVPIQEVSVQLYHLVDEKEKYVMSTTTDNAGSYVFENVETGQYMIKATYATQDVVYRGTETIHVVEGTIEHTIQLEKQEPTVIIFGVKDEEGVAIEYAKVEAKASTNESNWSYRTNTDQNGQAQLVSKYNFPIGTEVTYTVAKEGYKTVEATAPTTSEGVNELNVVLEKEDAPAHQGQIGGTGSYH